MPAGLRITRASNGAISIDENYYNLALRTKGTLSVNQATSPYGYMREVTIPSTTGMMAYRCNQPTIIIYANYGPSSTTFRFFSGTPSTVDYWYFDLAQYGAVIDDGEARLMVWRADGSAAFDSRLRYLRLLDFRIYNSMPSGTLNYPGAVPAVIQGSILIDEGTAPLGPPPSFEWVYLFQSAAPVVSGTTLTHSQISLASAPQQGAEPMSSMFHPQTIYSVIDVAGL